MNAVETFATRAFETADGDRSRRTHLVFAARPRLVEDLREATWHAMTRVARVLEFDLHVPLRRFVEAHWPAYEEAARGLKVVAPSGLIERARASVSLDDPRVQATRSHFETVTAAGRLASHAAWQAIDRAAARLNQVVAMGQPDVIVDYTAQELVSALDDRVSPLDVMSLVDDLRDAASLPDLQDPHWENGRVPVAIDASQLFLAAVECSIVFDAQDLGLGLHDEEISDRLVMPHRLFPEDSDELRGDGEGVVHARLMLEWGHPARIVSASYGSARDLLVLAGALRDRSDEALAKLADRIAEVDLDVDATFLSLVLEANAGE